MDSFLDKLIDWKDFEKFVAGLYADSDELIVEHNITERGNSGAKRQIDVRVFQKIKLHTIKIIIECKRWKDKVSRQVIDVLFASVEDLNANKGVIFTTKGYEEGAIEYAKSKNIDIFIVRDIYENEWGQPGRHIVLYFQLFNAMINNLSFEKPKFYSPTDKSPTNTSINFEMHFEKDQKFPEHLNLYSLSPPYDGPNFVKLLIEIRNHILKQRFDAFNNFMQPVTGNPEQAYESPVKINFSNYPFKFFKHETGYITFDSISFSFHQSITQSKMEFDRAAWADFAVIVENYITNQKNFATKSKVEEHIKLSEPIEPPNVVNDDKAVKNGSVFKISLEHYVSYSLQPTTKIIKTPEVTVSLQSLHHIGNKPI